MRNWWIAIKDVLKSVLFGWINLAIIIVLVTYIGPGWGIGIWTSLFLIYAVVDEKRWLDKKDNNNSQ